MANTSFKKGLETLDYLAGIREEERAKAAGLLESYGNRYLKEPGADPDQSPIRSTGEELLFLAAQIRYGNYDATQ